MTSPLVPLASNDLLCAPASFEITIAAIVNAGRAQVNNERLGGSTRPSDDEQGHVCQTERVLRVTHDKPVATGGNRFEFETAFFVGDSRSNKAMILFDE
jgi:hypothetical protein